MKLKKLIASVLAFTMVVAIPHQISHAENNPTPESFATIEDSIDSNPHMKNAIENIRKVQEDYNKTFFAREKHTIIKNRLNIVESELKALEKIARPENQKKIDALRFEKEFLITLKQNTEDPFFAVVLKIVLSANLYSFFFSVGKLCWRQVISGSLSSFAEIPLTLVSGASLGCAIGCAIWGFKNLYKLIF